MQCSLTKRIAPALAAAAILIGSYSDQAQSALIATDLLVAGDKLITRDTATGLDWLDVNLTSNTSFNDMLLATTTFASLGNKNPITDLGFAHATSAQVATFFTNAGIPNFFNNYNSPNFIPADSLVDLVGITFTVGQPDPRFGSVGATSDGPILGTNYAPSLEICVASTTFICQGSGTGTLDIARVRITNQSAANSNQSTNGHWLIRPTYVPEPASLALFGIGLAGLGLMRRRKRVAA